MTRMKYFELFTKYIKGEINVNGLILEPTSLYFKGEIIFQIKNPNDVSYSIPALNGYLIEILTNFNEFLGIDDNEMIMTEFISLPGKSTPSEVRPPCTPKNTAPPLLD